MAGSAIRIAVLLLALVGFGSASEFTDTNPIRSVTDADGLASPESAIVSVLGSTRDTLRFARFARKHGKRYESAEEIQKRFSIFSESLVLIRDVNRRGLPYRLGINHFADMSWDEFRTTWLGASQNCSATKPSKLQLRTTETPLPETKDWREDGIVSPVKNQGSCGSCWTFSTTGALEAAHTQATGKQILLSEQQLVDCAFGYNNFGCNGGLPSQAFEYVKYSGGLDTEESYPYAGVNGVCRIKSDTIGVKVVDSVNITEGAEDELTYAVAFIRPVSVAFEVIKGFKLYKSGVYTSDSCGKSPMDVNHAVLAVGYGVENGMPYWLIKNSWGKNWGLEGYFKMERGKNMCGVATCASYPIVDPYV